jgi:hypothetical protein
VKRFRGCLGIALIFFLGLVVGAMLGFGAGWMTFFHKVVKGGPVAVREILFKRAKDDLGLDYGQQEEIRMIMIETATELEKITATVRPAVEDAVGRAKERFRAILTPKQRAKFDPFIDEGWKKWRMELPATTSAATPPTSDSTKQSEAGNSPVTSPN